MNTTPTQTEGRFARSGTVRCRAALAALLVIFTASALIQLARPTLASAATSTSYRLPWQAGAPHSVIQGWGGTYSHPCPGQSCYAYDFKFAENTPVRAAANGTVAFAVGKWAPSHCGGYALRNQANYVTVYQTDGTATLYLHLSSVVVHQGDQVTQGQLLGYSGKTGYTRCGPHLHFARQKQGSWITNSLPVYFDEYPGRQLAKGSTYTSGNTGVTPPTYERAGKFVDRTYQLALNRVPDAPGRDSWTRALSESRLSRPEFVTKVALSDEGLNKTVSRDYQAFLHRPGDAPGIASFVNYLRTGGTREGLIAALMGSDEYYAHAGSTTDGFIRAAYVDLLGRSASDPEVSTWESTVAGPNGRTVTALKIETSREARNRTTNTLYASILTRPASDTDRAMWFNAMQNGSANAQSQDIAIMASDEAFAVANR